MYLPRWISERCAAFSNTYSVEWFYVRSFKGKSSERAFTRFWKCDCRACLLIRLLVKSLLVKQNTSALWLQAGLVSRLGLNYSFFQLVTIFTLAAAKSPHLLRLRCIEIRKSMRLLLSSLNVLASLAKAKASLVSSSTKVVNQMMALYARANTSDPVIINKAKKGLTIAANKFNFLNSVPFAAYAK